MPTFRWIFALMYALFAMLPICRTRSGRPWSRSNSCSQPDPDATRPPSVCCTGRRSDEVFDFNLEPVIQRAEHQDRPLAVDCESQDAEPPVVNPAVRKI